MTVSPGRHVGAPVSRHLAIVPAHNEADAIAATIADINTFAPDFDVLVVDDGSTDQTMAIASRAGAGVVRLPFNLGIGGAVQTGYVFADEHGYDIAVQVDGDGQHDASELPRLLDGLRRRPEIDMVVGSRFLSDDGGFRSSAARRAGIRIFARLLSRITGQLVTDPTSGFRMVNRTGIRLFASDYPHDYPEVEAILLMHAHKLRSCEIPVRMRQRTSGVSAISFSQSGYYMIKVLLAVFIGLFRSHAAIEPGDTPVKAEATL
jgi:glycosyltransferase involved in cell wall biosynthesis